MDRNNEVPGLAPEKLVHIFQDQIVTLNQIHEADELKEVKTHEVSIPCEPYHMAF